MDAGSELYSKASGPLHGGVTRPGPRPRPSTGSSWSLPGSCCAAARPRRPGPRAGRPTQVGIRRRGNWPAAQTRAPPRSSSAPARPRPAPAPSRAPHLLAADETAGVWPTAPFLEHLANTSPETARPWLADHATQLAAVGPLVLGALLRLADADALTPANIRRLLLHVTPPCRDAGRGGESVAPARGQLGGQPPGACTRRGLAPRRRGTAVGHCRPRARRLPGLRHACRRAHAGREPLPELTEILRLEWAARLPDHDVTGLLPSKSTYADHGFRTGTVMSRAAGPPERCGPGRGPGRGSAPARPGARRSPWSPHRRNRRPVRMAPVLAALHRNGTFVAGGGARTRCRAGGVRPQVREVRRNAPGQAPGTGAVAGASALECVGRGCRLLPVPVHTDGAGSAAVVAVDLQGAGLVVEVVAAQVVDGAAAAGDADPAASMVALFVDAGGAVGVVADRAAAVPDLGREVLHAAVGGAADPGLSAEVDLWVDADVAGRAVDPSRRAGLAGSEAGTASGARARAATAAARIRFFIMSHRYGSSASGRATHPQVHSGARAHGGCRWLPGTGCARADG